MSLSSEDRQLLEDGIERLCGHTILYRSYLSYLLETRLSHVTHLQVFLEYDIWDLYASKIRHWNFLEEFCIIPVSFIERYFEFINGSEAVRNFRVISVLGEKISNDHPEKIKLLDFYDRHAEKLDWREISSRRDMPLDFYDRHAEKLDWDTFSFRRDIPLDFYDRHVEKLDWSIFSYKSETPFDFYERHAEKVKRGWKNFFKFTFNSYNQLQKINDISLNFLDKIIDHVDKRYCRDLSKNKNIPLEFWDKHPSKIHWFYFFERTDITIEFVDRHHCKIDSCGWRILCKNYNFSEEFWQRCITRPNKINKAGWRELCKNPKISENFFEKYASRISKSDWDILYSHPKITIGFLL